MNHDDLNKVWEIKALKKPREDEARRLLERVGKQVQPIMRRRKWKVKLLSEFCPTNSALLGLNIGGGAEVKLRLRSHNRDWDFFPFEQVLDTMLHELCHIQHGSHNAAFYKLWDELRKECEELVANGISGTGQGFDIHGRRLGGFSRQPPASSLRQAAVAAAAKRAQVGALLPAEPNRLGGNSDIMGALSPIQAAAMAAERRMYGDVWCGSVSDETTSEVASSDGMSERNVSARQGKTSIKSNGKQQEEDGGRNQAIWECGTCTLFNQPMAVICEACGSEKPKAAGSKFKTWSCKFLLWTTILRRITVLLAVSGDTPMGHQYLAMHLIMGLERFAASSLYK